MSKMDGLRAMREAKYAKAAAATQSAAGTKPRRPVAPTRPTGAARPVAEETPAPAEASEAVEPPACGHRNMGGRTCTREQGHAAKNHRYS